MEIWIPKILAVGLSVVYAVAIFIIGKWLAGFLSDMTEKALGKTKTDIALVKFLKNLIYFALLSFVVIAALGQLGIQTASFVAVLGAAGFAVGMALQGSLSNFAAGVMILIFKPFYIGDFVTAGGVSGNVASIKIFNTILYTPDNVKIIIPNSQVIGSTVMNYVARGTRRIDLKVGVAYKEDLDHVRSVIQNVLSAEKRILGDPAPVIAVGELADSSINFFVRPWVKSDDYWDVQFALNENIKKAFDKNGIEIPFRQMDVFIRNPQELPSKA